MPRSGLNAPPADDPELIEAAAQFIGIFFDAMRQYGFEGAEAVDRARLPGRSNKPSKNLRRGHTSRTGVRQ
jgi:hypothetical protein